MSTNDAYTPLAWMAKAPCSDPDGDIDLWFSHQPEDRLAARAICKECPVRSTCETYGADEQYGIWGGIDRGTRAREKAALEQETKAERKRSNQRDRDNTRRQRIRAAHMAYLAGDRSETTIHLHERYMKQLENNRASKRRRQEAS